MSNPNFRAWLFWAGRGRGARQQEGGQEGKEDEEDEEEEDEDESDPEYTIAYYEAKYNGYWFSVPWF